MRRFQQGDLIQNLSGGIFKIRAYCTKELSYQLADYSQWEHYCLVEGEGRSEWILDNVSIGGQMIFSLYARAEDNKAYYSDRYNNI